jgi:phage baseplate assembly protein W
MTVQELAIALPFQIDISGSVASTTDQDKIWQDRVLSVVGTAVGERVQNYYFGSKVHYDVFNTQEDAATKIEAHISEAFMNFLPLLSLRGVASTYDQDSGELNVTVTYLTPTNDLQQANVGTFYKDKDLPPKEL